jgi:predicted CoA-substrate-specific enzyme activase
MICAGIDGGSRAIKVVLYDAGIAQVLARGERDQGIDHDALATELLDQLLTQHNLTSRDVKRIVATGYTRNGIRVADTTITEITCHAFGVRHLHPDARTVIEIGGQDSKLLRLDADGTVRDFAMNDRCAAGTGRFLEVVASRLGTDLASLGDLASKSRTPAAISSTCVVFAETEIIGLLASGTSREDIVAGVQTAMASRIAAMAGRHLTSPLLFTGGVARVSGMRQAMETALGHSVQIATDPQFTGALGAAILAGRQLENG